MADNLDYLSPSFDLSSLTVPRLRSILVSHDISYPASAKKAQLIRILEDEVLPQSKKLLRERERVKRTSAGITDMGSRASSVAADDGDDRVHDHDNDQIARELPPPTPSSVSTAGRRGRSRMSTRASTAETDDSNANANANVATPSTARSTGRRSHRTPKLEAHYEEDVATPVNANARAPSPRKSTARKTRRSEYTPSVEPDPEIKPEPVDEESVFTTDNPFQSGSPEHHGVISPERKRMSSSRVSMGSPAVGSGLRARKSETPSQRAHDDHKRMSTRFSADFPVSPSRPSETLQEHESEDSDEEAVGAGEEFTPDEQLALENEQADLMYPPTQKRRPRKQGTASRAAPWIVLFSILTGFAAWWRQEKIEIGFCGIGKPTWSLAETKVPEWANNVLEPQCEPCPAHAFCYPNLEARCEHDFILKAHPLSLGGLIPLPPTCEPDSEKARRVKAVADKAVEELRDRRAKFECGELSGENKGPEVSEPELKQEVGNKRRRGMSDMEFDDLWKGALGDIVGKEEVVSRTKQPSAVLTLSSTSISRLPLTCAFRRHIRLSLLAYRLPLSLLATCIGLLIYARSRVLSRRSDMARVPDLVATTLDRLATQAALHARGDAREPYIPIGQLRDDVLRSELRGSRREELWRRVRNVVEGNANIRAAVREGRGGDVARVWEWIGGIGGADVERSSSPRLQPSQERKTGLPHDDDDDDARAPAVARRWDEGRPIY